MDLGITPVRSQHKMSSSGGGGGPSLEAADQSAHNISSSTTAIIHEMGEPTTPTSPQHYLFNHSSGGSSRMFVNQLVGVTTPTHPSSWTPDKGSGYYYATTHQQPEVRVGAMRVAHHQQKDLSSNAKASLGETQGSRHSGGQSPQSSLAGTLPPGACGGKGMLNRKDRQQPTGASPSSDGVDLTDPGTATTKSRLGREKLFIPQMTAEQLEKPHSPEAKLGRVLYGIDNRSKLKNWNGKRSGGKNALNFLGMKPSKGVENKIRLAEMEQDRRDGIVRTSSLEDQRSASTLTFSNDSIRKKEADGDSPALMLSEGGIDNDNSRHAVSKQRTRKPLLFASNELSAKARAQSVPLSSSTATPEPMATSSVEHAARKLQPKSALLTHGRSREDERVDHSTADLLSQKESKQQKARNTLAHLVSLGYSVQKLFLAALAVEARARTTVAASADGRTDVVQHYSPTSLFERDPRLHVEAFALNRQMDPARLHRWLDLDPTEDALYPEQKEIIRHQMSKVRGLSYTEQKTDDKAHQRMTSIVSDFVNVVLLKRKDENRKDKKQHKRATGVQHGGHEAQVSTSLLQSLHTTASNQELFGTGGGFGKDSKKKGRDDSGFTGLQGDLLRAQFRNQIAYDGLSLVDFSDIYELPVDKVRLWLHQGDQGRNPVERTAKRYLDEAKELRSTFLRELDRNDLSAAEFCSQTQATPGDLASWLSGSTQYHRPTVRAVWLFVDNSQKEVARLARPKKELLQMHTLPSAEGGPGSGPIYERQELLPRMQRPTQENKRLKPDAYGLEKIIAHRRGCAERCGEQPTQASLTLLRILKDAHSHRSVVASNLNSGGIGVAKEKPVSEIEVGLRNERREEANNVRKVLLSTVAQITEDARRLREADLAGDSSDDDDL